MSNDTTHGGEPADDADSRSVSDRLDDLEAQNRRLREENEQLRERIETETETLRERLAAYEELVSQITPLSRAPGFEGTPGREETEDGTILADGSNETYKVLGQLDESSNGIGVLGCNTASSGTTYGVKGEVASPDGYGLATTDGAKIQGTVETGEDWVVEAGDPSSGDAQNIVHGLPENTANNAASGATIAGGGQNDDLDFEPNEVYDNYATVGGGAGNVAGTDNDNQDDGRYATVSGGEISTASGVWSAVGGGFENEASGTSATVAGGSKNISDGNNSTVPGGRENEASGSYSFAAGRKAKAVDAGAFVWADSRDLMARSDTEPNSSGVTGEDIFKARCQGGAVFVTGGSSTYIPANGSGWSTASSRATKTNIEPVDPQDTLEKVDSLDVATWEYEDDDGGTGVRQIGPMAEEFHDAFDVGDSDEHINSVNADGAAFAAIQGLSEKLDEREERIDDLEAQLEQRDERIDDLAERLAAVEGRTPPTAADD